MGGVSDRLLLTLPGLDNEDSMWLNDTARIA